MPKKQPRVPEMHDIKPNREQRRHPEGKSQDTPMTRDTDIPVPNMPDVPAKSTGGGKKTADKWNQ
ncbi:MAG: hypothetical protein QOG85_1447 [Gaiellaceae bacterium]|jgi:hypothetical protein|nr:hypothetical protein [Gaiellaceae bacterium]